MSSVIAAFRLPIAGCLACAVLLGVVSPSVTAAGSLGDLTGPWHLFVDDYAVAARTGVVRTYHPFQKYPGNPVMVADRPWEGASVYLYGTVLPNESGPGCRMWYQCLNFSPDAASTRALYATSADGIHWDKPNLGIASYNGSTNNNFFMSSGSYPSVMHTPWDADMQRPYKLIRFNDEGSFVGSWSVDAIHWTDSPNNPVVPPAGDVGNFVWDPHTQQYIGYPKVSATVNDLRRRAVGFTATAAFESWSAASLILAPDSWDDRWVPPGTVQRTHFYGLCGFAYESMYLGLLWIFRATDVDGYYDGPIYVELVSSHDGIHWTREEGDRPPILALGPAGAWDDGMIVTATHPLVEGNVVKVYYGGFDETHVWAKEWRGSIGLATLRKDGFASLDAGATVGTITTQKIDRASGPLRVNFTAPGGWVKAEVLDEAGNVQPGYGQTECNAIMGDSVDQVMTWAAHAELPATTAPLSLRFILQNASVYSFAAGDSAVVIELPTLTLQPADRSVPPGTTVTFTVDAKGTRPLSYQWRRFGCNLTDGGHYSGATTPTLTISNADAGDLGDYRCVVTNAYGYATSDPAALSLLAASLAGVGALPGYTTSSVTGISADGSVVCGASGSRAILWTASGGIRDLGVPADATSSSAAGVGILNGNVVVAVNTNAAAFKTKRWDGSVAGVGTYASLPKMGGTLEWTVRGLGTDGLADVWIAGSSLNGGDGDGRQAGLYRQSTASTTLLGLPANGHDHSDASAVADNGYVAGQYQHRGVAPTGGARNAMKYTGASPCAALNTYFGAPSTAYEALAKAISRNGLVQGGWSHYSGGGSYSKPIIWNNSATPTTVSFIPGGDDDNYGEVLALNGDGTSAGGYSFHAGSNPSGHKEAFIWDAIYGTRQLQGMLTTQCGLELGDWALQEVRAISADGKVVAGNGLHSGVEEGWVVSFLTLTATVPADFNQDGDVDYDDFNLFENCFSGAQVPLAEGCDNRDLDYDNDVDQSDFGIFQRCYSGENNPAGPNCAN